MCGVVSMTSQVYSECLLSTAIIRVFTKDGEAVECRALLDSSSQSNLITESLCKSLGLEKQIIDLSISGVSQVVSEIKGKCSVTVQSLHGAFTKGRYVFLA